MFLFDVTCNFDKACAALLVTKPDVLEFVRKHERRNLILNNLCLEVQKFEKAYGQKATYGKRNEIIFTAAKMFCELAEKAHEQKMWSESERRRQESKNTPYDEMRQIFKEEPARVTTDGVTEIG